MDKLHHTCNRDGRAENVRERKRGKGREDWKGGTGKEGRRGEHYGKEREEGREVHG